MTTTKKWKINLTPDMRGSTVDRDGVRLGDVRKVTVTGGLGEMPIVTIELVAKDVEIGVEQYGVVREYGSLPCPLCHRQRPPARGFEVKTANCNFGCGYPLPSEADRTP